MKQLPALKLLLALCAGIIAAYWMKPGMSTAAILSASSILLAVILCRTQAYQFLLYTSLASLGILSFCSAHHDLNFPATPIEITGIISEPPLIRNDCTSFPIRVKSFNSDGEGRYCNVGKVRVSSNRRFKDLEAGMMIRAYGILSPIDPPANPGEFDYKTWSERNGYIGNLKVYKRSDLQTIDPHNSILHRIRNLIFNAADTYGKSNSGLMKALLLGYRRDLDDDFTEELRLTGLSHLLALSGLHVGFIVGILIGIGSMLRLTPALRSALAIIGIVFFMLIVPARSSTLRASLMAIMFISGPIFKRWSPPLNTLAAAGLIILLFRPAELFDAGFQLSFAAVAGIILFEPLRTSLKASGFLTKTRKHRLISIYLVQPLFVSIAASVFVLPLTSYHFGYMALGGPLYNLIAIPVLWFVFAVSWLIVILAAFWSTAASFVADGLSVACDAWKWLAHHFATTAPGWDIHLLPLTIILISILLTWLAISKKRLHYRVIISVLVLAILLVNEGARLNYSDSQVWFLSVGNGDSQVWLLPGGKTIVIDGGKWREKSRNPLFNFLKQKNTRQIDLLVASHPDADHIGGLVDVVRDIPVKCAITSTISTQTETFERLLLESARRQIDWKKTIAGAEVEGLPEGFNVTIMSPPAGIFDWSTNDASVVMLLTVIQNSDTLRMLTTGDAEAIAEKYVIDNFDVRAELLKAGHHGSPTSTGLDLIDEVSPEIAVISRDKPLTSLREDRCYEVIERLQEANVHIAHTGIEGALLFEPGFSATGATWEKIDWQNPSFIKWLLGMT